MQVILTSDVSHLGNMGEVVNVSAGYGRNYLIPQRLAVQATASNKRHFQHVKRQVDVKSAKMREAAVVQRGTLDGISITLAKRTAGTDKLYGSVTNREIAEALESMGHAVDKRQIEITDALKELGVYEVPVKLHSDVTAKVRVWIVKM